MNHIDFKTHQRNIYERKKPWATVRVCPDSHEPLDPHAFFCPQCGLRGEELEGRIDLNTYDQDDIDYQAGWVLFTMALITAYGLGIFTGYLTL